MISPTSIEEVKAKVDLVDLLENELNIPVHRTGAAYKALCPLHSENTPSFNINPSTNTYKCFGCGESGDAIQLLIDVEGYTFSDAVERLAERAGIVLENTEGNDPLYEKKKNYIACVAKVAQYYRNQFKRLPDDHPAKVNLANRNYLQVEGRPTWLEDFGLGYAPDGYDAASTYLRKEGFTDEQIVDAGLAFKSDKTGRLIDRFRNRLLWEIRDIKGRAIGFSGRRLNEEDNPKYLNTPETVLYKKSKIVYGIDLARKRIREEQVCYVVEGAADVMAIAAVGMVNTVASCGTAFGEEHANIIREMIDDFSSNRKGKYVFVFDNDPAGIKAAMKMFDLPGVRDRAYVVILGDGDPVDVRKQMGDDFVRHALVNNRIPLTKFVLQKKAENYTMENAEEKNAFVQEALTTIAPIKEALLREDYRRHIALLAGVPLEFLGGVRYQAPRNDRGEIDPFGTPVESKGYESDAHLAGLSERNLVALLLQQPMVAYPAIRGIDIAKDFASNDLRQVYSDACEKLEDAWKSQQPPTLQPHFFHNQKLAIDMFHSPLDIGPGAGMKAAKRLVEGIREAAEAKRNQEMRSRISGEMNSGLKNPMEALAELVRQRQQEQ